MFQHVVLELVYRATFLNESAKAKISNQNAFRHPGSDDPVSINSIDEALAAGFTNAETGQITAGTAQKHRDLAANGETDYDAVYAARGTQVFKLRFLEPKAKIQDKEGIPDSVSDVKQPTPEPTQEPTQGPTPKSSDEDVSPLGA